MATLMWGNLTIPPAGTINSTAARDRTLAAAGHRSAVPLTYGVDRLGGLILNVLPASAGSPDVLVQCLWGFACDGISDLLLNDAVLPGGASVVHFTGAQTTPSADLVTAFAAISIVYEDTLAGYAYSVVRLPTRAFDGQLNITALVRGRRCYDPRLDSTAGGSGAHRLATPATWEWTDNPAVALADFLASSVYGLGRAVAWSTVPAAANANDALVLATEKRRTVGVSFISPTSANDIADTLRAYAGCFLLPSAAGIKLLPDADDAVVATYTHDSGAIAAIGSLTKRDLGNAPTVVEVLYTDTTVTPWREESAAAILPGAGSTRPWRLSQVRMPGIQRYSQANREAIERLNKLNLCDLSFQLEVFDTGIRHEPGDIVQVSHPIGLGFKPMRVTSAEMAGPGRWLLDLVEHQALAYSNDLVANPPVSDTNLKSPAGPPDAPTGVSFTFEPFGVRLVCARNLEPDVVGYQRRVGSTFAGATVLEALGGTTFLWGVQGSGTYTVWTAAVDADGNISPGTAVTVVVVAGSVSALSASIVDADLQLDFEGAQGSFALAAYRVLWGDTLIGATEISTVQTTRLVRRVDWLGSRRWWVVAVDVRGNEGAGRSIDVAVAAPGAVTSRRSEVVDNNVLLFWSPPATGSLPVDRYEVRKGATWAGGVLVGSNGNSTFAAIFEQASGTFTYWVAAVDTAGNLGEPVSIVAAVSQPPDYVLRQSWDSTFTGTAVNFYLEGGRLLGPVDTSQTWATHFTANAWTTPQNQVDAGFPLYLQPSVTSGSYEETFDYGAVLPPTVVTATLNSVLLAGSVTVTCQIDYKTLLGDPWTAAPAGLTSALIPGFRYLRVTWSVACTAGANAIRFDAFNLTLANKLKTDSGSFAISNASTGVTVPFNVEFIDTDTPICQPSGTSPLFAVVDFTDTPYPTEFTVYLYNLAGTQVTGSGSWTARGY